MTAPPTETYTVGVFKDVTWASRGLDALAAGGFGPEVLSLLARESPEVAALVERLGGTATTLDVPVIGPCLAAGSLASVLQAADGELTRTGLARSFRRAGFQAHDGQIYEALTARGGVLVAIRGEARAADALAVLHAYGGGNAAIGAWHGRV